MKLVKLIAAALAAALIMFALAHCKPQDDCQEGQYTATWISYTLLYCPGREIQYDSTIVAHQFPTDCEAAEYVLETYQLYEQNIASLRAELLGAQSKEDQERFKALLDFYLHHEPQAGIVL